jgi:hypothetical protein
LKTADRGRKRDELPRSAGEAILADDADNEAGVVGNNHERIIDQEIAIAVRVVVDEGEHLLTPTNTSRLRVCLCRTFQSATKQFWVTLVQRRKILVQAVVDCLGSPLWIDAISVWLQPVVGNMQEEPIGATPRDVHHGVYREEAEVDLTFEVQRILTMLPVTRANAAPGRFEALQVVEQYADNLGEVAEVLLRLRLLRLRLLRLRLWLRALILLAFHLPQQTVNQSL